MPFPKRSALPECRFFLMLLLGVFAGSSISHAEPTISGVSPGAVKPGEAIDLTITGSGLADAGALWTSFPAEVSLAPDIKDNGKQADRVVYRVKPTGPHVLGVHGIRVVSPQGVSSMKLLVVDDMPSVPQQSGNNSAAAAQQLALPIAVDVRVDNLSLN
jgi:hypothetical protein